MSAAPDEDAAAPTSLRRPPGAATSVLALGALGVVYGDIGTNPLFAMREAFEGPHHVGIDEANVLGLLSLMFWSLILVISVKYLGFVMRADNDGEGGILALAALVTPEEQPRRGRKWLLVLLGLFGAALLYGDGVITPAISVLAAVEGAAVAEPGLDQFVIPAAIVILIALFLVQRKGTASIGKVFGPVMIVWFVTLGVLGAAQLVEHPDVLRAINPEYAVTFFGDNGFTGFLVLGAVILVVVGGEALYADMGHFGRRPILLGWYGVVLPTLLLVYFGQGALLIDDPSAIENPFYRLAPDWALIPLVVLATGATVIASQALISGAYSLTRQAVQLGYSPRVHVQQTSEMQEGQIYISSVNWLLMVSCIGLVLGFQESANLAAAYGLAVTTTMVITTMIFFVVARERFRWRPAFVIPLCGVFFIVDLAFFGATLFKIPDGGWFPLVAGAVVFTVLSTWRTGRLLVRERLMRRPLPLRDFVRGLADQPPLRAPGSSAYLFRLPGMTPPALLAALRHHDSLHEQVLVVAVETEKRPYVHPARRAEVVDLGDGFHQVSLRFGFMDDPDVPRALAHHVVQRVGCDLESITYFLGRESLRVTKRAGMARWRERLFAVMSRNATSAAEYFGLPIEQTVEIGVGVEADGHLGDRCARATPPSILRVEVGEVVNADAARYGKPLDDVRVLAIEQMQALPYATQMLARFGATVVKVEPPGRGESGRQALPAMHDPDGRAVGATFLRNNFNKRSICVDLKHPEGRDLILRLAPNFDVIAQNFKAGTVERLGLAYDDIARVHPTVVYLSVSGFGTTVRTRYDGWPAYAPVAEAMAGLYTYMGQPATPPPVSPMGALGDTGTALFSIIGVLAALEHRDRTGEGQHIDVAMLDAMVAMGDAGVNYWSMGLRSGASAPLINHSFRARDGWFIIQCGRVHQFAKLAETVEHPEWLDDPRLPDPPSWFAHIDDIIRPAIERWAASRDRFEVCRELAEAGVAAGPVHTAGDVMVDEHVQAHHMIVSMPRTDGVADPILGVGNPVKLSKMTEGPETRVPWVGEHTDEVLREELDLTDDELKQLHADGAIA